MIIATFTSIQSIWCPVCPETGVPIEVKVETITAIRGYYPTLHGLVGAAGLLRLRRIN